MQRLASADQSSSSSNTNLSTSLSLSILDQAGKEMALTTGAQDRFEFIIPRDPTLIVPAMVRQNATSLSASPHSQLFNLHYVNINQSSPLTISLHFEMRPVTMNVSYLLIYRFDGSPQLNRSVSQIDGWSLLCSSNVYTHFIDNHRTVGHQSVIYGLRELSSKEVEWFNGRVATDRRSPVQLHVGLRAARVLVGLLLLGCAESLAVRWLDGSFVSPSLQRR